MGLGVRELCALKRPAGMQSAVWHLDVFRLALGWSSGQSDAISSKCLGDSVSPSKKGTLKVNGFCSMGAEGES